MTLPPEIKRWWRQAERDGWEVKYTAGSHIRFRAPDGAVVIVSATPSKGHRSLKNCRARLRRAGMAI